MPLVSTVHSTYVHHVALDPSGSLIATCSSDKTVNIFHRRHLSSLGDTDEWDLGSTIRDHSGPVVRLAWCHLREHGPMLATAGADRWIHIYRIVVSSHEGRPVIEAVRWTHARGFEKDAITDVAFIPPQQFHVLLLSTASLDGSVRLYEIQQPTFQLLCRHTPENDSGVDGMTGADESTPTTVARPGMTASGGPSCSPSSIRGARSFPNSSPASAAPTGQGFEGVYRSNQRGCGVTTISWFPGATERTMTLAVGALSGKFFLYRFLKDQKTFAPIPLPASVGPSRCAAAVEVVAWAPAVGRRFNLLAVCSRVEVIILRLNCTSPSAVEGPIDFEVFRFHGGGAVSVTWSRSATMLYCVADSDAGTVSVLRMRDPLDHQSWEVVSEQGGEPTLS